MSARTARSTSTRRFNVKTYSDAQFNRTVLKMRTWLKSIASRRNSGTVTADDVHTYLDREGVRRQQVRTRLAFINAALRTPYFTNVGDRASLRPAARYRTISVWMPN